jgi:hydroxymethylbilane synthase
LTEKIIRIATRQSPLALWQAEHVAHLLEQIDSSIKIQIIKMLTRGDKMLDAPLAKVGGKGLFVKELEQGMLEGLADIAVHSMKDVPIEFPDGLHLSAILPREDPTDAFVSNHYASFDDLKPDARIGTSSLRRQCQIKVRYPHSQIIALRGNVNTRLAKLDEGDYDAIILASAGLKRLGLSDRITHSLDTSISLPAIGQGAIGIECRVEDTEMNKLLSLLHDKNTGFCVAAERAMNFHLNGGCQVPIAGFACLQGEQLLLRGLVGEPDGSFLYRSHRSGHFNEAALIGQQVADDLLSQGAGKVLQELLGN